jgi:hypothetical protein
VSEVYTYVIEYDRGLAPNPFGGYCTLAVCTPNHMGCQAVEDDWIAGVSNADGGHKLIYAMQVSKVMNFNDYFNDPTFASKKPLATGTPEQRCGDNFYSIDDGGLWIQHWNPWHDGPEALRQDTKYPKVFIAERFWYLGRDAMPLPDAFRPMFGGHGLRKNHGFGLGAAFQEWATRILPAGLNALPRDLEEPGDCTPPSGCRPPTTCSGSGRCS